MKEIARPSDRKYCASFSYMTNAHNHHIKMAMEGEYLHTTVRALLCEVLLF